MKDRGVHLQYSFQPLGQRGAELHNPLFELLSAVAEHGSIQHAAKALGASYRHVWGACKHWESVLGEPLMHWVQGQPARLTPFAERLLWEKVIAASLTEAAPLFDIQGMAASAAEAHALSCIWNIHPASAELSDEVQLFIGWQRAFEKHCQAAGWLDAASLHLRLIGLIEAGHFTLPEEIGRAHV